MNTQDLIKFVSDGFDIAKSGAAMDVYASVVPHHDVGNLPLKSHEPFGWIIYYALHQSPDNAINERKHMLARYLSLQVKRPHKLHSMILTEAFRLYKNADDAAYTERKKDGHSQGTDVNRFSIVKFVELWDLANLRPGDWRRKEYEGKAQSATVEKLITHYVDELYTKHIQPNPEFLSLMERALTEYQGSANLYAQNARLHEIKGDKDKAIDMLRQAILASSAKSFLWSRLAELISDKENLRLKVSLLYRALQCPGPDDFKGKIHLSLAAALADGGAYPQAKWELKYVKNMYEKKDWNLPRLYKETEKKIPADTVETDPSRNYIKIANLADDFIYESLPEITVKKTYHKQAGKTTDRYGRHRHTPIAWRVTDAQGTNYWLTPSHFGIAENMPIDAPLSIKVFGGKVVKAKSLTDS